VFGRNFSFLLLSKNAGGIQLFFFSFEGENYSKEKKKHEKFMVWVFFFETIFQKQNHHN
jgi:hypothetical protein